MRTEGAAVERQRVLFDSACLKCLAQHEHAITRALTGDTDYLLKIVAEDWEAFQKFLTHAVGGAPNIAHVKSALAIRTTKLEPGVPVDVEAGPEPDEEGEDEE